MQTDLESNSGILQAPGEARPVTLMPPFSLETLWPKPFRDPKSEPRFLTWDVWEWETCVTPPAVLSTLWCVCICLWRGSLHLWPHKGQNCEYSRGTGIVLN